MSERDNKSNGLEEDFGDITFEDEDNTNSKKDGDLHKKQVIFNIYENLARIKQGKEINQKNALPEEHEINKVLKSVPKKIDVIRELKEYPELLKKSEEGDEQTSTSVKMDIFYNHIDKIDEVLNNLSKKLGKDIAKDMIERGEIEERAQKAIVELQSSELRMAEYSRIKDEMFREKDKSYKETVFDIAKKTNLTEAEKNTLLSIKKDIDWVIGQELKDIENKKWEYADEDVAKDTKKQLLELKQANYQKLFTIKNLASLGLIMERREGVFAKLEKEVEKLNELASDYHPVKF